MNKHVEWQSKFDEYLNANNNPQRITNEENERVFYQTNELLSETSQLFLKYGRFKDEWDNSKCYINFDGQNIILKSLKMNHDFHWGVTFDGFYVSSYVLCDENLKNMDDDFWSQFLQLKDLGDFKFEENNTVDRETESHLRSHKSNLFKILRNYILFEYERMDSSDDFNDMYTLGNLRVEWVFDGDWNGLLDKSSRAFKIIYNLNYQLWKVHDLKQKRINKKKGYNKN